MPAARPTARRLRLLATIDDLAAQWLEHRDDHQLLALARDPRTTEVWQAAAGAYPHPARGQIALAEALLEGLHAPENSFTPRQITSWRESVLAKVAELEALLDAGPGNLVATLPWEQSCKAHTHGLRTVMEATTRAVTLHGAQISGELAQRKYFVRTMTLAVRGLTGSSQPRLVAALARAAFPGRDCDSSTVWRACEDLGSLARLPSDAALSDHAWLGQVAVTLDDEPPPAYRGAGPSGR